MLPATLYEQFFPAQLYPEHAFSTAQSSARGRSLIVAVDTVFTVTPIIVATKSHFTTASARQLHSSMSGAIFQNLLLPDRYLE